MGKQINIEILRYGKPPSQVIKQFELQFVKLNDAMEVLGLQTRDYMRDVIATEKHRKLGSQNNLENHINIHVEDGGKTIGIGSRAELDHFAPYWYLINYGGMSYLAKSGGSLWGSFDGVNPPSDSMRGTGVGTEFFFSGVNASDGKLYQMSPTSPVWAMNYIEKTINWLDSRWRIHTVGYLRKIQTFAN